VLGQQREATVHGTARREQAGISGDGLGSAPRRAEEPQARPLAREWIVRIERRPLVCPQEIRLQHPAPVRVGEDEAGAAANLLREPRPIKVPRVEQGAVGLEPADRSELGYALGIAVEHGGAVHRADPHDAGNRPRDAIRAQFRQPLGRLPRYRRIPRDRPIPRLRLREAPLAAQGFADPRGVQRAALKR
jgi:hypothetical protein